MQSNAELWPWAALLLLGALHGINPGMGWLFAVALGMQEDRAAAVWKSLLPLAVGHAAAVGVFLLAANAIAAVMPLPMLKVLAAAALFGFACQRLFYRKHPRYGGMRVGQVQLAIWSFLMASAHGAGLMVVPFMLHSAAEPHAHAAHPITAGVGFAQLTPLNSMLLHTASYLFVTGVVAVVVYEKAGLRLLRSTWINLDIIWTAALMLTAVLTLTL